jgi:RNA polymerase sigma factor (sigma-70 family)
MNAGAVMGDEPTGRRTASDGSPEPDLAAAARSEVGADDAARVEEFSTFYREYMPRLVRYLMVAGVPTWWAAELAQETMAQAWRAWGEIETPKAWCRRAAYRSWIRLRTRLPEEPVEDAPEDSTLIDAADIHEMETRNVLLGMLNELSPRERQVMAMVYDGDTTAEIAHELGATQATVRSTLRNARRKLAHHRPSRPDDAGHRDADGHEDEQDVDDVAEGRERR